MRKQGNLVMIGQHKVVCVPPNPITRLILNYSTSELQAIAAQKANATTGSGLILTMI